MKSFASSRKNIALESYVNKILFTGFIFLFGYLLFLIPRDVVAPLAVILLGIALAIFIIVLVEPEDFKFLFALFTVGFGIRVFIALLIFLLSYQYGVFEGFLFRSDAPSYSEKGWYVAQCYKWGLEIDQQYAALHVAAGVFANYDLWCGLVYSYVGKNPLVLFFINSLANSLTIIFVYSLAKELGGKKVAPTAAIFVVLWPSLIFWSTQNFKDSLISFAVVLFFYSLLQFEGGLKIHFLPIIIFCLFVLSKLSPVVALSAVLAAGAGIVFFVKRKYFPSVAILGLILLYLSAGYLGYLWSQIWGWGFDNFFDALNIYRGYRAEGELAFFPDADLSTPVKTLFFLPFGLLFAWFAPFPWQVSTIQLIALPEMLLFYLLFPNFLRGIHLICKRNWGSISAIVFFMIIMSLVFALIEGNSGTLLRHRSYIIYFCFIFISVGIFRKESVTSEKDEIEKDRV